MISDDGVKGFPESLADFVLRRRVVAWGRSSRAPRAWDEKEQQYAADQHIPINAKIRLNWKERVENPVEEKTSAKEVGAFICDSETGS